MSRVYIAIILSLLLLSLGLSFSITLKNGKIDAQSKEIIKVKIEKKTATIAGKAIGEIYQVERIKDVKKPHAVGTNTATF